MRYFNNALEDRRVYIRDSGINPYAGSYTTPTELRKSLTTGGKTLTEATVSNIANTKTNTADSYTGSSNAHELSLIAKGSINDTTGWTSLGALPFNDSNSDNTQASLPRYSDLPAPIRKEIDKTGEIPTYVGSDGKVHVDREALIQRVVDYYAGPEGGSMNLDGFSAERFANAGHDERMAMLGEMRKQNDAAKAAKFEEDLKLAQERDAAKEAQKNQAGSAGGNTTGQIIATVGQVIGMLV